jgi:hypothetical protein
MKEIRKRAQPVLQFSSLPQQVLAEIARDILHPVAAVGGLVGMAFPQPLSEGDEHVEISGAVR